MARKPTSSAVPKTTVAKTPPTTAPAVITPVRNSAIPPKSSVIAAAPAKKSPPSYEAVELRAYFIWKNVGGNPFDNWIRAERELSI